MGFIDLTNQQFGSLLVLERDKEKIGKVAAAYWICKCECGNIKSVRSDRLKKGEVTSCGCIKKERQKDITSLVGKIFGRLTVIERDLSKPIGHGCDSYWICKCSCGKEKSIRHTQLIQGKTKSCGCLRSELRAQKNILDITSKKYGFLEALERTEQKDSHGSYIWKCLCHNCGLNCFYSTETLQSGRVVSCGCKHQSIGEKTIEKILIENNINFAKQYTFDDLLGKDGKIKLRFDFAIFENNKLTRLIEFDGEQHFNSHAYDTGKFRDSLEEIQARDRKKDRYCMEHNIPLIRIPYTELKNLNLEILLNDKFLISKLKEEEICP